MRPVRCEFRRGGRVESVHHAVVAVVRGARTVFRRGAVEDPVWMRSSAKPFQTLAVTESGAADRFGWGDPELSVMSGSHGGDPEAVRAVRVILRKSGLPPSALRCGAHPPASNAGLRALHRSGRGATALHNNCSGKHAGMVAATLHLGAPLKGYLEPDHPLQRRIRNVVSEFTGIRASRIPLGVDGCSAPTFFVPLRSIAGAMARFCGAGGAARRIRTAMMRHPSFVGRPCGAVMSSVPGRIVTKVGAEGVYVFGLAGEELGIATKILDGNHRATVHVLAAVVRKLRLLAPADLSRFARVANPVLRNHGGREVGEVRVVL